MLLLLFFCMWNCHLMSMRSMFPLEGVSPFYRLSLFNEMGIPLHSILCHSARELWKMEKQIKFAVNICRSCIQNECHQSHFMQMSVSLNGSRYSNDKIIKRKKYYKIDLRMMVWAMYHFHLCCMSNAVREIVCSSQSDGGTECFQVFVSSTLTWMLNLCKYIFLMHERTTSRIFDFCCC